MTTTQAHHRPVRARAVQAVLIALVSLGLAAYALIVPAAGTAHAASTLLSQGQPVTASSVESGQFPAADGNTGTRWSSAWSDPQWLQVELGSTASVTQVVLMWEAAYATGFQIQV